MAITKKTGPGPKKKTQSLSDLVKAGKVDANYMYNQAQKKKKSEAGSMTSQIKSGMKQTLAAGYGVSNKTTKPSSTKTTTKKANDPMKSALAQKNTKKKTNQASLSSQVFGTLKKGYGIR